MVLMVMMVMIVMMKSDGIIDTHTNTNELYGWSMHEHQKGTVDYLVMVFSHLLALGISLPFSFCYKISSSQFGEI